MSSDQPFLTIIFPAHNEEGRIRPALEQTIAYLVSKPFPSEIIVVENGSTDRTFQVAESYRTQYPFLRVVHEARRGKGLAVKRGMQEGRGLYRFFCDVDLSMPIGEVDKFLPPAQQADVVIASREVAGAQRFEEPALRHLIGRVFNALVKVLVLPGIEDSQCGFKCYSANAAVELFPLLTIPGWTFDVELLYLARKRGFSITEVGIAWHHDPHSKVKVLRDSMSMLTDLIKIRWNDWRGVYAR